MIKTLCKKKKGSVLVFAVIILSIMTVTALGLARVTHMGIRTSLDTKNSGVAFQKAETGMEEILFEILKNSNDLDTLMDLLDKFPGSRCENGVIFVDDENIEFSFTKMAVNASGTGEAKKPITDCTEVLADITAIKIGGEHGGTARAFYQNLKSSLKRDLVAHWKFEDNVDALLFNSNFPGSPAAKDSSDNNHTLTLCPIDNGSHSLANNGGNGNESFNYCHHYENTAPAPDPAILGDGDEDYSLEDSIWMDHGGAFFGGSMDQYRGSAWGVQGDLSGDGYKKTSGVINEYKENPITATLPDLDGQALYFNGRSNYLTMNTSESTRTNYVKNEDKLEFKDKLSVSFWVKFEGNLADTTNAIILEKHNGANKGYKIYIKDPSGEVCVDFGSTTKCGGDVSDGNWHHVAIAWDRDKDSKIDMYIDNSEQISGASRSSSLNTDNTKFLIGGKYTKSDGSEPYLPTPYVFPHTDLEEPFKGYLDDLRLYDRKLSPTEIHRLCIMGDSAKHPAGC